MAKSKGGPFFKLIDYHLRSAEYAFTTGDYANCISHMESTGELLNVNLPSAPFFDPRFSPVLGGAVSNTQRGYIIRYRPLIAKAVRKWMDKNSAGRVGLWRGEDSEEEDDSE